MRKTTRNRILLITAAAAIAVIWFCAFAVMIPDFFSDLPDGGGRGMGKALFVMDVQKDFIDEDGRLPVNQAQVEGMLANINSLIDSSREKGLNVIYVRNVFPKRAFLANRFRNYAAVEGGEGAAFDERLTLSRGPVFTKSRPDAFSNEMLGDYLSANNIGVLYFTGVFADQCVLRTALVAVKKGYRVICIEDAVAGKNRDRIARTVRKMERAGISIIKTDNLVSN